MRFSLLFVLTLGSALAQEVHLSTPPLPEPEPTPYDRVIGPYRAPTVRGTQFTDSQRLESLIRAGNLYLSLKDAIALALENNLDVELARYQPRIADTDILRSQAGSLTRGIDLTLREGPTGAGAPRVSVNQSVLPSQPTSTATQFFTGSAAIATGPQLPLFDPTLLGGFSFNKSKVPQTTPFNIGASSLSTLLSTGNVSLQKGFLEGGTLSGGYSDTRTDNNNRRVDLNPYHNAALNLSFTQPLLRGFGSSVNGRYIRVARNNRQVADLNFKLQVIATVTAVVNLYWDLVSLRDDLEVRRQSLSLSQRLLSDNQEQVNAGTLAPIEVVNARSQVASSRRDLTVSETLVLQQETVLKDFLTRSLVSDPILLQAHVLPTDHIDLGSSEVQPIEDLVALAYRNRADLGQTRLNLDSSNVLLRGSRNALLPQLDVVVSASSQSLYGPVSTLPPVAGSNPLTGTSTARTPSPNLIGGVGTGLEQVFSGKYPTYGIGINLTVPVLNRQARADFVRDELVVRQQEVRMRQLQKQIRVDVVNATIAVQQARASYDAARQAREFSQQSLDSQIERYRVGAATSYNVIQFQRDLAQAKSTELVVLSDYVKARNQLERALGRTLESNGVQLDEVYTGRVSYQSQVVAP